ncbi:Mov34/MPN/PAD-1 family protein [Bradyrhizobium tropiciagri]|uniref:Mov34/MPN/PAD-1 family protein n=1 Tax=Bradyrhizobium tropiciagri TaxID=312253 RepID=UPI0012FEB04C|nr:Mov34/MPN/PAD-1 family protein [Bradyrhizobium tropiciagri]
MAAAKEEACYHYPLETGGTLVGYWSDADTVVVTRLIGPGPASIHGRYSFEHDHEWEAAQIADHYYQSARSQVYIGDWHTHPDASSGELSGTDRRAIRRVINYPEARVAYPLMMVLFGGPEEWKSTIWAAELKPRWPWGSRLSIDAAKLHMFE